MTPGYRLPGWVGPPLMAALMSGVMSLIVSGVATFRAIGWPGDFGARWFNAWLLAWPIAFSTLMIVAPLCRRIVAAVVAPPSSPLPPAS